MIAQSHRRVAAALMTLGLVGAGLVGSAAPAGAATLTVRPGQSIQAAIDAAPPGSTIKVLPGTYREELVVAKDSVKLQGSGPGTTRLVPPGTHTSPCGDPEAGGVVGICVVGQGDLDTGVVDTPVRGVQVTGFSVSGFGAPGILVFGGSGTTIQGNRLIGNAGYGAFALSSTGTQIVSNEAAGSEEAGIYVGDSPNAAATIRGNDTHDNGIGIFLRSASKGVVTGNDVHDNCAGILLLNEPNASTGWLLTGNTVRHNAKACPGSEEQPPISGVGIVLLGALQNTIQGNTVTDNAPGGDTAFSGGIVLFAGSSGNTIAGNTARRNVPVDLADDSGAPNRFSGNHCDRSRPPGLCTGR